MGLNYRFLLCLLLWGGVEQCCPYPILLSQAGPPGPVEVECLEAQLVVKVSRDLFGTGKLVQPADLSLGPERCQPLVSLDSEVVRFEAGLHECGNSVQLMDDALVYSTFLLHDPRPAGNLSILRTSRAQVPIECRYPRQGNVSSHGILPTWVPFWTTMSSEESLMFSLRVMQENWSAEKSSPTFYLGEVAHLQAEVHTSSHFPLRLFVDYCVATATPDWSSSPYHVLVNFHGCLVDGVFGGSSAFQVPRPGPEILQFTMDVFHFANDSRNTIYITCHLKVIPATQAPDPVNKACSFSKSSNSWSPVEGTADICKCCDTGNCSRANQSSDMNHGKTRVPNVASRKRRHMTDEADVTLGPLIFLGKAGDYSVEGSTSPARTSMALGLGLATVAFVTMAVIIVGLARDCHTASHSVSTSQ
ncbi:zona pellucida sperm-binding protein 3 [Perognathus longimembris pacificus]|uniref:zona pellucida sperm-binding protein 3 n=1 Tax=Perognathus longimembris pacificus TaxID=214514 RepID=UPI00201987A4|nr:zona pellucida sperm-binding protein 3 [Perognathus longimembris pacificus]